MPDRHAEQPLELLRQAGEPRAAAGDDDLADREAARLRLVVGQRRDELADERLDPATERVDRRGGLLGVSPSGASPPASERLRLTGSTVRARSCRARGRAPALSSAAAPLEDARELADAAVRDGQRRAVVPDRDGDERRLARDRPAARARGAERTPRGRSRRASGRRGGTPRRSARRARDARRRAGRAARAAPSSSSRSRARGSRAPPRRAGSAAPPGRGSGSR